VEDNEVMMLIVDKIDEIPLSCLLDLFVLMLKMRIALLLCEEGISKVDMGAGYPCVYIFCVVIRSVPEMISHPFCHFFSSIVLNMCI